MTDSSEFSSHSHGEASSPEELFSLAKAHGESFPVLKAFQNYLDQERERARRRTMVLVLSFLGVVVALIIAFVVLFVSFFNVVLQNNEQQQVRMLSLVTGRPRSSSRFSNRLSCGNLFRSRRRPMRRRPRPRSRSRVRIWCC